MILYLSKYGINFKYRHITVGIIPAVTDSY